MLSVRQRFPDRSLKDIPGEVRRQLEDSGFAAKLAPGSSVAIGVGSRGITNLAIIVRAAVDFWKSQGMRPFIFPAMGSHGAATAAGQADVLAHYGVTEAQMGCPVISQLEVVHLGKTPEGIDAYLDRTAYESGGVMLVSRVKWHTNFEAPIESGLFKMMAIGLGKFAGAQKYHTYAYRLGLEAVIRSVGRQVLRSGKIIGGLAILEDAYHNTGKIEAVPVETMERREEELLALVKSWMGKIPVPEVDVLILDEIGKNISGSGADTKVINRSIDCHYNPWDWLPRIHRIFIRGLSDNTYGNAVGIGFGDIINSRMLENIDWNATNVNSLTASTPGPNRIPMNYPTDRECLERIWPTVGKFEGEEITYAWIRNTMELGSLVCSENLRAELERNPDIEIAGAPFDLPFDETGNLVSPFARAGAHEAGQ
jgi:hypothetical protein